MYSSISQGSVIDVSYSICINDITDNLNPGVTEQLFADDVTIHSSINHEGACTDVQTSLYFVSRWIHDWQLKIPAVKSSVLKL